MEKAEIGCKGSYYIDKINEIVERINQIEKRLDKIRQKDDEILNESYMDLSMSGAYFPDEEG